MPSRASARARTAGHRHRAAPSSRPTRGRRPARAAAVTRRGICASANGQRSAKRQPGGRRSGLGTWPSIEASRRCSPCRRGIEPSRPTVYGCCGVVEQRTHRRLLDDAAGIHHHHLVGHFGDDAQVVRDQDDRRASLLLQALHQVEDLGLDRHVQRGRRLVGDQQARLAGQRHRDHRALAHAARELVRVLVEALLRRRNAHLRQHRQRARAGFARVDAAGAAAGPRRSARRS